MIFAEDSNNEQSEFDTIVGCIEDIVIGEKFQDLQVFKYLDISNIYMLLPINIKYHIRLLLQ